VQHNTTQALKARGNCRQNNLGGDGTKTTLGFLQKPFLQIVPNLKENDLGKYKEKLVGSW
jgi:hypothetical protein